MPPFKKGGSFVRFFVEGSIPDPATEDFLESLAAQRFRTIESAASEETSAGWVSASDPSGQDFLREDVVLGDFARLRIRVDKKKLPASWLAIHMAAEIRARDGQKISAREKKAIRADIEDRVLPRTLPSVSFLEVVYVPAKSIVMLFSTSQAAAAECAKLFHKTFGVQLVEMEPTTLVDRSALPKEKVKYLDHCSPFSLRPANGTTPAQSNTSPTNGTASTTLNSETNDATSTETSVAVGGESR